MKILARVVGTFALLIATAWSCAALWIDGPEPRGVAGALTAAAGLAVVAGFVYFRPYARALGAATLPFVAVFVWWNLLTPSNDRPWEPSVAHTPIAEINGDLVTIQNVRNFEYRSETDFTEHWETRTYDLSKLEGVDLFLSYWGSPLIAHTIASWDFGDGRPLAISIETRKEEGESYSAVLGFFRQFELYYVLADERDLVGVRTHERGEDVYLYRTRGSVDAVRAVLVDYLEEVNRLAEQPKWYNAATHNCTTTIRHHLEHVSPGRPWDWRILVNGYIDELGYERGSINTTLPFDEIRRRSAISAKAQQAPIGPDYSTRIREGLPERPPPR